MHHDTHRVFMAGLLSIVLSFIAATSVAAPLDGWSGDLPPRMEIIELADGIACDEPSAVAMAPDGSTIVVSHVPTGNVSILDGTTLEVMAVLPVGTNPLGVAITADSERAVVTTSSPARLTVIDLVSLTIESTLPVSGVIPRGVALTSDGSRAVVFSYATPFFRITVLDLERGEQIAVFPTVNPGFQSTHQDLETFGIDPRQPQFAVSPDGTKILIPDTSGQAFALYSIEGELLAEGPLGAPPIGVTISADGSTGAMALDLPTPTIAIIDLDAGVVVETASDQASTSNPRLVGLSPDGMLVFGATEETVWIFDRHVGFTVWTPYVGRVDGIELMHDQEHVLVLGEQSRTIELSSLSVKGGFDGLPQTDRVAISPNSYDAVALSMIRGEFVHRIRTHPTNPQLVASNQTGPPHEIDGSVSAAVTSDGAVGIIGNAGSGNVCIVDLETNALRSVVEVGFTPLDVQVSSDDRYVAVCCNGSNAVTIIDLKTDAVVQDIAAGPKPRRALFSADGQRLYVLSIAQESMLTVIDFDGQQSKVHSQLEIDGPDYTEPGHYLKTTPSGMALSDDGTLLAICQSRLDRVSIIDTTTMDQLDSISVGDFPLSASFNHAGNRLFVTNAESGDVTVLRDQSGTWSPINTIEDVDRPLGVEFSADDRYAYICHVQSGGMIHCYDTLTNQVVSVSEGPQFAAPQSYAYSTEHQVFAMASTTKVLLYAVDGPQLELIEVFSPSGTLLVATAGHDASRRFVATSIANEVMIAIDVFPEPVFGDLDDDGDVDPEDLMVLLAAWGTDDADADLDGSGTVDVDDLLILLANWT